MQCGQQSPLTGCSSAKRRDFVGQKLLTKPRPSIQRNRHVCDGCTGNANSVVRSESSTEEAGHPLDRSSCQYPEVDDSWDETPRGARFCAELPAVIAET